MKKNTFKHQLGKEARSKTTKLKGILTARSENLYGCNRYFVQPPVDKDQKLPDGWWHDEDDIEVIGDGVDAKRSEDKNQNGGPISKSK